MIEEPENRESLPQAEQTAPSAPEPEAPDGTAQPQTPLSEAGDPQLFEAGAPQKAGDLRLPRNSSARLWKRFFSFGETAPRVQFAKDDPRLLFSGPDLRRLIVPLIIEQFLQSFVGLADSIMVASVGEAAVSGVSLVDTVMLLLINIFAALATGGAVVAGQYLGKKEPEKGCRATNQLVLSIAALSLVVTAAGYLLRGFILNVVFGRIDSDVMYNSNLYLLIVFASIPFIALYNAGAAVFRAMGNSKISMLTALLMNALNLGGNALLIYGFHRGIEGVAIPTLVSRVAACAVILALLCRRSGTLHFARPFRLRPDAHMLRKIFYIGIPNGLENSMFQLGKILVLSLVAGFGTASIAANAVANNISAFAVLPGSSIGMAMLTVVSRCVGARDYAQVRYYTRRLMRITYLSLFAINGLVLLLTPFIIRVYNLSQEASDYTYQIMVYYCICTALIWAPAFSLPNTLRAANDVRFTMIVSVVSMWLFRVALSYLIGDTMGWGVFGVWVAMTIDWLCRAIFFYLRYRKDKWEYLKL